MLKFLLPLILALALLPVQAQAQTTADQENMKILVEKIKADKKLVVAANMELSDTESAAFWPIYESYQRDLASLNQRTASAILNFADAYNKGPLSDEQAQLLIDEAIAIEKFETGMLEVYAQRLSEELAPTKVVRYLQIESKIRAAIRFELAASIPLAY